MKAWCKHSPENPCNYCQDKHDEHQWCVNFASNVHEYWLERKRLLANAKKADAYWLALTLIKNHGSHDHAVLREIARGATEENA